MLKSMTAFGRARKLSSDGALDITAELRSVNSRYLDVTVRMSRQVAHLEDKVKAALSEVSFGANGFGGLNFIGALLTEVILTFVFVLVILCVTQSDDEGTQKHAGLFIGAALTFVHLIGIGLTGTSVNPARSIAPAVFAIGATDGKSILQLWVFIVGPLAGAFLAAFLNTALIKKKG